MKHILVPTRVFEMGDRVFTSEGMGTVIHDELEDFDRDWMSALSCSLESKCVEEARQAAAGRQGIFIRLDYPTSKHPRVEEDYMEDRDWLILPKIYKECPKVCPSCGSPELEDESTAMSAQRLWHCRASRDGKPVGCGEMFLVDKEKGTPNGDSNSNEERKLNDGGGHRQGL